MLAAVLHISCCLAETPAPVPKHSEQCPRPWLSLASSWTVLEAESQVGPYPSRSKIVPAEGCAKPLERVEAPGSISSLLLFRVFPFFTSTFEQR